MTTTSTSTGQAQVGALQTRLSDNVQYLVAKRRTSFRRLAMHLGLSSSGMSARQAGTVEWRPSEIESAAAFLHVPWTWMLLPEAELVAKCTARDLNSQPADSMHDIVVRLAAGVRPSPATPASPRASVRRLDVVRPGLTQGGAPAAAPRSRVA